MKNKVELIGLIDEPKFKQGDMVLVSNDGDNYRVREYIGITSEGKFLCWYEDKKNALPFKYIKPYKEEIKPGDWVKNNYGLIFQHKFGEHTNECTKITNPELIKLLENEII